MCMADQTIIKPLGLIKDLKILVHGTTYVKFYCSSEYCVRLLLYVVRSSLVKGC
jgi:hypothetical protein